MAAQPSSTSDNSQLDNDNSASKTSTQQTPLQQTTSSTQSQSQNNNGSQIIPKQETNQNDSNDEKKDEFNESKTNLIINYIPPTMSEIQLQSLFSPYGTMKNCKIVIDLKTNRSRGYGFVEYANEASALNALQALNGFMAQGKKLKVAFARPKCKEIQNSNLFITNLPIGFTENELRQLFDEFGQIVECRILPKANNDESRYVGFVRMDTHLNAINALQARDNHVINPKFPPITVKLAQRYVSDRVVQQQHQHEPRNKNYQHNSDRGNNNNRRQSSNRRYVRQPNNQQMNFNNNYNNNYYHPNNYNYNNFQNYNYHNNNVNDQQYGSNNYYYKHRNYFGNNNDNYFQQGPK